VTVGTLFEDSKVPLHKWVYAMHLYTASKKGFSAHQFHRTIGVSYKTAWFMAHRIREAMRPKDFTPMGGDGQTVEVDETVIGTLKAKGARRPTALAGARAKVASLTKTSFSRWSSAADRRAASISRAPALRRSFPSFAPTSAAKVRS
jgi:hypothetical protein